MCNAALPMPLILQAIEERIRDDARNERQWLGREHQEEKQRMRADQAAEKTQSIQTHNDQLKQTQDTAHEALRFQQQLYEAQRQRDQTQLVDATNRHQVICSSFIQADQENLVNSSQLSNIHLHWG